MLKEKEEISNMRSLKWANMFKKDPKMLWKMIDWKGKTNNETEETSPTIVHNYFKNVFQSDKTVDNPKLYDLGYKFENYNIYSDVTDATINMDEMEYGIQRLGTGSGLDGIPPSIIRSFPRNLIQSLLILYNRIFDGIYPDQWNKQLLIPVKKEGHSVIDPKLRGIAIAPVLCRVYDIIMNKRFREWYYPNRHQAGFRKSQGCIFQIFSLFLYVDMAKYLNKKLFICLLDYEKAFDFANRSEIANQLMINGIGNKSLQNFKNTYSNTCYIPKISKRNIGRKIVTHHGVTQGKNSSADIFSFYVSDMHVDLDVLQLGDFMGHLDLLQMADDTTILADNFLSLTEKVKTVIKYSKKKYLEINNLKTKYMEMSINPTMNDLYISRDMSVKSVRSSDGYNWLGFWLSYSNDVPGLILANLNKKRFNISKFYNWLDVNESTPFIIKLRVLYSCMFASVLYSCESWGDVTIITDKLLQIERNALKRCLGVKLRTTADIIYYELNLPDIKSVIIQRQFNFINKIQSLSDGDAIVKDIWNVYRNSDIALLPNSFITYYLQLQQNAIDMNICERKTRIMHSDSTMCVRYRRVSNVEETNLLYKCMVNDEYRQKITRWRLSSHKLYIETGRYKTPPIPRECRNCSICNITEDEYHALFVCFAYWNIRNKYNKLLKKYETVSSILNPNTADDIKTIAK